MRMMLGFALPLSMLVGCSGDDKDPLGRSDAGASPPPLPCVEPRTPGEAMSAFARIEKREDGVSGLCAKVLPELGSALIGVKTTDAGCVYRHVLHRCRAFEGSEAAPAVLGDLGWAEATPEARARLAAKWSRQVVLHGGVLEAPTVEFSHARRAFAPPAAEPTPTGGVRFTAWRQSVGANSEPSIERYEVVFSRIGGVSSVKAIGRLAYLRRPLSTVEIVVKAGRGNQRMKAEIRSAFALSVKLARWCYEVALVDDPDTTGTFEIEAAISADGSVTMTGVKGIGKPAIDDCMRRCFEGKRLLSVTGIDVVASKATIELTMTPSWSKRAQKESASSRPGNR